MDRIAVGTLAGLLIWQLTHPSMPLCGEIQYGDWQRTAQVCLASYEQTGNEGDGARAGYAYMQMGQLDQADALAHRLLTGASYGDAHVILSYVALRQGFTSAARMHATIALVAHTLSGDEYGLARDYLSISEAAWKAGDFTAALDAADQALTGAERLHDPHFEVRAVVVRADALRRMGDTSAAAATLTTAIARASDPCDLAWLHVKKGMCQMEAGQDGLAKLDLDDADRANRRCPHPDQDVSTSIAINLAWIHRWDDPSAALASLEDLPGSEQDDVEVLLLRGYLAADRGALAESERYLARAAVVEPLDADWPWEVVRARAELSELRGGPLGDLCAEAHYRRAMAMVAALRATARARSAYFVSSHRGPFDGLIALLARNGRWREVLAVILDLDASDMLRATAAEVMARDRETRDMDIPASSSVMTPPATVEDVLSAWRSRDLVIVIAASERQIGSGGERVYRLRISDGQVAGADIGDASTARKWADDLFADPGDRDAARGLGRMIVPSGAAGGTLHVLAIGALGKVPLPALRDDDGSLSIGRHPLVRVLALRAKHPEASGAGASVVIADPRGDLPSAAKEGAMVAAALGPGAQVSGPGWAFPATRVRLWGASNAELLHVAAHVGVRGRWNALRLADGDVDPVEIIQRRFAPRIAVLASCGSAAATDEEGWGSLAAALLGAGTSVVIATDRSVGDAASLSLMRDFYAQSDWRTDPARALARVQQAMDARAAASRDDATKARSWAAFSVLGRPPEIPVRSAVNTLE